MVVVAIYVGFIGFKSVQMGVTCKWGWKRLLFMSNGDGKDRSLQFDLTTLAVLVQHNGTLSQWSYIVFHTTPTLIN